MTDDERVRLRRIHDAILADEERMREITDMYALTDALDSGRQPLATPPDGSFDGLLRAHGIAPLSLPRFDLSPIESSLREVRLAPLPAIDDDVFARWRGLDVPMMFLAGAVGAGLSAFLRETFASWHDDEWQKLPWNRGGHGGEIVDNVPGSRFAGGFGHRWKHGHDLLNPFEVQWDEYLTDLPEGGVLPPMARRLFYWIRHLLQDSFSKEGLGLPGHSCFREMLEPLIKTKAGRETLQALGSIKARDLAGVGAANVIMGAYLWGTEGDLSRVVVRANYRAFSLMAGANLVAILCGLLVPPPATSFQWPAIPPLLYYGGRLVWMMRSIEKSLDARDEALASGERQIDDAMDAVGETQSELRVRAAQLTSLEHSLLALRGDAALLRQGTPPGDDRWSDRIATWETIESDDMLLRQVVVTCAAMIERRDPWSL